MKATLPSGVGHACLIGLASASAAGHAAPPVPMAMDFVTHDQILVKASPERIWPFILKPNDWKQGPKAIPIAGPPGGVGERFDAIAAGRSVGYTIETVELVPRQIRTIRLDQPDGALIGYVSWRLARVGRSTLVQYDVYCRTPLPQGMAQLPKDALAAAEKGIIDENSRRFTKELIVLKALTEAPSRPPAAH